MPVNPKRLEYIWLVHDTKAEFKVEKSRIIRAIFM